MKQQITDEDITESAIGDTCGGACVFSRFFCGIAWGSTFSGRRSCYRSQHWRFCFVVHFSAVAMEARIINVGLDTAIIHI
jgi:hypothetical protein